MKTRLDQHLVELALAPSRAKAQELIESGVVFAKGAQEPLRSKALQVETEIQLEIRDKSLLKYVSRGGLKLESALQKTKWSPKNKDCLDAGSSTGGFTDCLLGHGANSVDAVDVGTDQLHPDLRSNEKVRVFENQDIREFNGGPYEFIVADLSFISLTKVLPTLVGLASPGAGMLFLIKPQFEVGSDNIGKKGIVKSQSAVQKSIDHCWEELEALNVIETQLFPSGLSGRDGNQEYFLCARKI